MSLLWLCPIVGFVGLIILLSGLFTVEQQTRAIVERFGRFLKIAGPGLNLKVPLIDRVAGRITHRVRELEIKVESKTKDDVFVDLLIAVQFFVRETDVAVLEVNTIPGLTEGSLFPKAAAAAGIEFSTVIDRLIACTLRRAGRSPQGAQIA